MTGREGPVRAPPGTIGGLRAPGYTYVTASGLLRRAAATGAAR